MVSNVARLSLSSVGTVLVACLSLTTGTASAQPRDANEYRVELVMHSPESPWKRERYVLRSERGRATVSVSKTYRQDHPIAQKVGLVPDAELKKLRAALTDCGLATLKPEPRKPNKLSTVWSFRLADGEERQNIRVIDPLHDDPRYRACADVLRAGVAEFAGNIPFRSVATEAGTYGYLHVASEPTGARLILDGKDTGETTPVLNMIVTVGKHDLVLRVDDTAIRRTYDVTILQGATTNLDLDLR